MLLIGKTSRILNRIAFPLLFGVLWELVALELNKPEIIPRVRDIVVILSTPNVKLLIAGSLLDNLLISIIRVLFGFSLAALIAIPLGIFMGYFKPIERLTESMVELLRPIPPLAWVPLVLAWFGIKNITDIINIEYGSSLLSHIQLSMIFIIFIGAFFPILLNTIHGVKGVNKALIESAKTLGATEITLIRKVILPAAFPSILTGMRIGMGVGWMCLVAAEMMPGSLLGLGYLIWNAGEQMRSDIIVAGIITIGLVGLTLDRGFKMFSNMKFKWVGR